MAGTVELFDLSLGVRRSDRIRLAGPNGSGKTSLLLALLEGASVPGERVLYLPQEADDEQVDAWLQELFGLPPVERGDVLSVVAALGSDPGRLLESERPSPGEARKLALALGLGVEHWLLLLDEPTNHLDLPSIERLETALNGYRGALVLVTHDDGLAASATTETISVGEMAHRH
jgi:ATPase subunit of ABC transporter with duplicated ATPase domains